MSERERLQAILTERGVSFDKRLGVERLRALVAGTAPSDGDAERIEVSAAAVAPVEVDETWPRQVAPVVWLDRGGRRYTDLGEAIAGDMELR